jgi:hypothetical protein
VSPTAELQRQRLGGLVARRVDLHPQTEDWPVARTMSVAAGRHPRRGRLAAVVVAESVVVCVCVTTSVSVLTSADHCCEVTVAES